MQWLALFLLVSDECGQWSVGTGQCGQLSWKQRQLQHLRNEIKWSLWSAGKKSVVSLLCDWQACNGQWSVVSGQSDWQPGRYVMISG